MGRFYFHLQADDQIVPDDEGADLPDLSAAEHEAILAARADEEGRALAIVPFTAVLPRPLRK